MIKFSCQFKIDQILITVKLKETGEGEILMECCCVSKEKLITCQKTKTWTVS